MAENEAMRATVGNPKGVLESIGGERFREVAEKMAALDATQSGHVQIFAGMLNAESVTLRAEPAKHDQALRSQHEALQGSFHRLQVVRTFYAMAMGQGRNSWAPA